MASKTSLGNTRLFRNSRDRPAHPSDRRAILIIHRDEWMRSWLREVLAAEGYQVLDAPTISAALHLSQTAQIDLVITDILMASRKGMRILQQQVQELLKARHLRKGRVIAIKHHFAFPPVFDVGKLFGIRTSLVHPFTAEQMLRAVRRELWMDTRTTLIHRLLHKFSLSPQHHKSFPSRRP